MGTPRRGVVHLVVPAPDGRRVLARPNGLAGWALPTIAADMPLIQWTDAEVTRASRALGAAVVPVRRIGAGAWEVEVRGRVAAAGNTWIGLDEVDRLGVDAGPARSVLGEDRPERGHLRPGWIADLETWIDGHFGRTGPLTIRCHWELSAVVSFPTADGEVVVKQNGPGFTREAAVLAALADVAHVPPVLATEDDRFALPWAGVEGADPPTVAAALGRLHLAAEDRVGRLRAAGCPTTDDLVRSLGRTDLEAHLDVVRGLGLAPSVVHADAHTGNVLVDGADITVIDWTDAVVGDPVLDLPMVLLSEAAQPENGDPAATERAVVEAWVSAHGSDPVPLLAAFDSVTVVACAVTVALYDRHVDDLPASAGPWWEDWTDSWRRRLDAAVASAGLATDHRRTRLGSRPMTQPLRPVLDGLAFAEGPRWHDGRLWFSDMHAHRVMALDPSSGEAETIVEVPTRPSGLGWRPDGTLLIVSMIDRRLLALVDDDLVEVADLSDIAGHDCNDMVVDRHGNAYVGNFGFDLHDPEADHCTTTLALVTVDGDVRPVADELFFPNGCVITPDGRTLIVGESFGACLTAFDIEPDGSLVGRREWARVKGAIPDGICLDAEGAVWMASPISNQVLRVAEGGEVLDEVRTIDERQPFACMLGGDDGRTLFVCTALESEPDACRRRLAGRIEAIDVRGRRGRVAVAGTPSVAPPRGAT